MKTSVERIDLIGADRSIELTSGLNIITGPIATGKTTLVRFLRFLLGGELGMLPPEAKETVTAVAGSVCLGDTVYSIVRPAVTTATARVDIASDLESWRLPASTANAGDTYLQWLLDRLGLPRLHVPSAPTKPDSDSTPVSIRDYWLYSYLSQKELGFEIFGHRDHYRNVKRKYVFDIVYGFYDVETAELQDRLRSVTGRLRTLSNQAELFRGFFEDTALENRAALEHELAAVRRQRARVEAGAVEIADGIDRGEGTGELQRRVLSLELEVEKAKLAVASESASLANLRELVAQLESQSAKLTRSIVAGKHLTGIDFLLCPRCGAGVQQSRTSDDESCYLCLQEPSLDFSRDVLIKEQNAVEAQLAETQDLLRERASRIDRLLAGQHELSAELDRARADLDFQTRAFVSERAQRIGEAARERTALRTREEQLREYLSVLAKLDQSEKMRAELLVERERIERALEGQEDSGDVPWVRFDHLESKFNDILERFKPPAFGEEQTSSIDRTTYLPIYHGRRFETLSSPGLATLVSLAYALAHHETAFELDLRLPGLLMIDALSEHLGKEGLDPERLEAAYDYLIELSNRLGDALQIVVVDSELPDRARPFVRLELSETNRLIRAPALDE